MYRRLAAAILRPHAWRMAGTIACNVIAAALDVFSFTLLDPVPERAVRRSRRCIPRTPSWITDAPGRARSARFLDPADRLGSLRDDDRRHHRASSSLKNVFVWLGGQLGASLQEYVTRDLRDARLPHLQRLPLGYFQRTKAGQIISRVLSDTEQTKALITELVTQSLQNVAQIVGTIVILLGYLGEAHASSRSSSRRCSPSRCSRCSGSCARAIAGCATTTARSRACCRKS